MIRTKNSIYHLVKKAQKKIIINFNRDFAQLNKFIQNMPNKICLFLGYNNEKTKLINF